MPFAYIFGEGDVYISFYGDIILVIEHYKLAQFKGSCEGSGFLFNALLEAAVPDQNVGVVVYNGVPVPVEF